MPFVKPTTVKEAESNLKNLHESRQSADLTQNKPNAARRPQSNVKGQTLMQMRQMDSLTKLRAKTAIVQQIDVEPPPVDVSEDALQRMRDSVLHLELPIPEKQDEKKAIKPPSKPFSKEPKDDQKEKLRKLLRDSKPSRDEKLPKHKEAKPRELKDARQIKDERPMKEPVQAPTTLPAPIPVPAQQPTPVPVQATKQAKQEDPTSRDPAPQKPETQDIEMPQVVSDVAPAAATALQPAVEQNQVQGQRNETIEIERAPSDSVYQSTDQQTRSFLNSLPKRPVHSKRQVLIQSPSEAPTSLMSHQSGVDTSANDLASSLQNHFSFVQSQNSGSYQPVHQFKKLRIRQKDISLEPQSKRMVSDMDPTRLQKAIERLASGEVDVDVRRLQAALFVSQVNAQITDQHKQQIGADLTSATPHYMWLSLWGLLLGAGITLLVIFGYIKRLLNALSILFYIFISLEYVLMFASLKIGNYGKKPAPMPGQEMKVAPGRICLAIPVGWGIRGLTESQKEQKRQNKIDVLTNTLNAALGVFEPTDIFVFHNSSDQELPDQVMMDCCEGKAVYVPIGIGSKSVSAYYGAMLGEWLGYTYVIVMDDDTRLPQELGLVLNSNLDCDAYCMAIAAASNDAPDQVPDKTKVLIGLQDIEYKLSDLSKLIQYNFTNTSSVLAPHGAINMWKTHILTDIMQEHNCIFHGEDYQMGLIMRNRHKNSRLGIISNCIVNTVAPPTLKELYMQRYTSWDLAAQQFLWGGFCASQRSAHYMQVLFCLPCTIDNLLLRVVTLEDIWTVLQDYLRVILLMYHIIMSIVYGYLNVTVLVMYIVVLGSQWVIAWALEFVKFKSRPDLQIPKEVRLKVVALFPIYRFCFSFVRVAALLRFFLKFESVKRNAQPIRSMGLPRPKQLEFAFPGLRQQHEQQSQGKHMTDPALISQVVMMTLNQTRAATRPRKESGDLPAVFRAANSQEVSQLSSMMPPTRIPVESRQFVQERSNEGSHRERSRDERTK